MPAHRTTEPSDYAGRELSMFLSILTAGAEIEDHVEIRWRTPTGMRRRPVRAGSLAATRALIRGLSPSTDVYVGVALRRDPRQGGRDGIVRCGLLHAELDRTDSLTRLAGFVHPPTMVVSSGTDGHVHAYWALSEWASPSLAEAGNRALAATLGADRQSCDAARILRPPGTLNHKRSPAREVRLLSSRPRARYAFAELTHGLPLVVRARTERARRVPLPYGLGQIPAGTYTRALAGVESDARGMASCPFHDDDSPSLKLYEDGHFYCFGCGACGSIVDFAGRVWGIEPRGAGFTAIVGRLRQRFGPVLSRPAQHRIP
jgi:hypothetical protein